MISEDWFEPGATVPVNVAPVRALIDAVMQLRGSNHRLVMQQEWRLREIKSQKEKTRRYRREVRRLWKIIRAMQSVDAAPLPAGYLTPEQREFAERFKTALVREFVEKTGGPT